MIDGSQKWKIAFNMEVSFSNAVVRRSSTQKKLLDTTYCEKDDLPPGKLPLEISIIERMMYLLRPDRAGNAMRTVKSAVHILSYVLQEHWEYCNIYTITLKNIRRKIEKLYTEFVKNIQTRKDRRTSTWEQKMKQFNDRVSTTLFDISTSDKMRIDELSKETRITMGQIEYAFLEDQRGERIGYCDGFTDRKWSKMMARKKREEEDQEKQRKQDKEDQEATHRRVSWDAVETEECDMVDEPHQEIEVEADPDYSLESAAHSAKRKRKFIPASGKKGDDMPLKWRHIRNSQRKVKPEFYAAVDKLVSKYHCSRSQAVSAVIVCANYLFGRDWKEFLSDDNELDIDTAPCMKQISSAGKAIEVLAIKCIVEQIMKCSETVITYHDDGSKKKGVGSFMVQGVTIDGVFRAFPALPIASESCENLASLKSTVLKILEICSGVPAVQIFEKITFRMMDSTSHNFGVDELVAMDLGTDHIPEELLCQTHPVLMFNREMVKGYKCIEKEIGKDKLYSSVLVDISNSDDTVMEQYVDVSMRFVSPDFNHKNWNYSEQFGEHIDPLKNLSVGLMKQRFDRFVYASALLFHHHHQIDTFLDKYEHVTNSLACIVRAFIDISCLNVMVLATAIIGLHLIEPYLSLTYHETVKYDKLIPAMQQLYIDLTSTSPENLLDLSKPAFSFVSERRYKSCLWKPEVIKSLERGIAEHCNELVQIFKIILPKLAEGWFRQRGDVFGFGDYDKNSEKLLISKNIKVLNKAPSSNMSAERLVGSSNYEFHVRGPNLELAGSCITKAKSMDLIEMKPVSEFEECRKTVAKVNEVVKAWRNKQKDLVKQGMSVKEIDNVKVDKRRNEDLEILKKMNGPFTNSSEVNAYVNDEATAEDAKIKRLYTEVRYARDTCLSLPKKSDIFRLKRNHKNLSVDEYATNLCVYLEKVTTNASVSETDFRNVLDKMTSCL